MGNLEITVSGEDSLWSPTNIHWANKHFKIYVERSRTMHVRSYIMHDYWTESFLLVSTSSSNKQQLCFERDKAEKANENISEKLCRIS